MEAGTGAWVYLVGAVEARPVKIGTASNVAARLRDLQCGSPVRLHVMWQTRGGRDLELALHQRFSDYRVHGEWFDFGEDHPVAIVATAAMELGHRAYPSAESPDVDALPLVPDVAEARRLAVLLREAFAQAGDPAVLTVAELLEHLRTAEPDTWRKWDDRPDRLAMAGRVMASIFRAARFDLASVRLRTPGRPTAYRLDQVLLAQPLRLPERLSQKNLLPVLGPAGVSAGRALGVQVEFTGIDYAERDYS
ncbi:GIY-YIG nuclease family protein [Streptomyces sp. Wh19]|uniref:GIY-YIG nuclease family protein n=1 Tax=Streptomyces sp. Wh19 TaxID=3076629 RepID=UPI0029584356|nr:GIY-YIG nuclease family protein [Streptomyces sp. Wh19]MDV9201703.1 GIY-YIG nuclease family protein [Streptomyces sp. Wh19]